MEPPPERPAGQGESSSGSQDGDGTLSTRPRSASQSSPTSQPLRAGRDSRRPSVSRRPVPKRCYSVEAVLGSPLSQQDSDSAYPGMTSLAAIPSDELQEAGSDDYQRVSPAGPRHDVQPRAQAQPPAVSVGRPHAQSISNPQTRPFRMGSVGETLRETPSPSSGPRRLSNPPAATPRRARSNTVSVMLPSSARKRAYTRLNDEPMMEEDGRDRAGTDPARRESTVDVSVGDDERDRLRRGPRGSNEGEVSDERGQLHDDVVGMLDCVDAEVGTVNHLQNVTNGIMFPNIPMLWNRRPNLVLARTPSSETLPGSVSSTEGILPAPVTAKRARSSTVSSFFGGGKKKPEPVRPALATQRSDEEVPQAPSQPMKLEAMAQDKFDEELDSDMEEMKDKEHDLDRHLKHVLAGRRERREKMKRALRGLWAYLKTPMGAITAIYGFLVAFWGAAIVLFLLGWIPTSSKDTKDKWVEISSQVENGLFTVTGVGLIPWRVIDTYRISIIYQLKVKTRRRRKERGLPPIEDPDDLPDPDTLPDYEHVLTEKEQEQLRYQQDKFAKSQTWYRPHATATHRAFPINWALWNTILMDGNSFFQCILCGTMWGLNRHNRPPWSTGILIPLSFLCGIGAGVLIWRGGVKTKKTDAVEKKLRKALGVDEEVLPEVKNPRRSTVSGTRPRGLSAPKQPKRSATIDVVPEMQPMATEQRLRAVDESSEEEPDLARYSTEVKDARSEAVPQLGQR